MDSNLYECSHFDYQGLISLVALPPFFFILIRIKKKSNLRCDLNLIQLDLFCNSFVGF